MEFINEAEFARMLGVTHSRIQGIRRSGAIDFAHRIEGGRGGSWVYEKDRAAQFVQSKSTFLATEFNYRLQQPKALSFRIEESDWQELSKIAGSRNIGPLVRSILGDYLKYHRKETAHASESEL